MPKKMARIAPLVTLLVLGVLTFSSLTKLAVASGISVGTYDTAGAPKTTFNLGEDVRIIATSTDKPITIKVYDPDNVTVYSDSVNSKTYDKTISGITTKLGYYTVEASSPVAGTKRTNFSTVFYNVIPEAPLGTASIAIVGLSALGFYGLVRRRKTTSF
jgi:hypothetical protein